MKRIITILLVLTVSSPTPAGALVDSLAQRMIGSAYTDNRSHPVLQRLCDEAGGRHTGSPAGRRAIAILVEELKGIGYDARLEQFIMPGWVRGSDVVRITAPFTQTLRAVAFGYVDRHDPFEAPIVAVTGGRKEDYATLNARGAVVLLSSTPLSRSEAILIAAEQGARGLLLVNEKDGGLLLARISTSTGDPSPIPAYGITAEEGQRVRRLCERSIPVTVFVRTESYCTITETANVVASLPGRGPQKIVLGAHLDSWDLGQGGIDNGTGTAVLFDVARLLKAFSPDNHYALEFVWFNGEELGIWGSKEYVRIHPIDSIAAVINLDMVGTPTGVNPMGMEKYVPFLDSLAERLNGFDLKKGQPIAPWLGSDHVPFMLKGIPAFTPHSFLEEDRVRYYHDFGDTFDKVSKKSLSDASAVVSILARVLANRPDLFPRRNTDAETAALFRKYNLDKRLKRQQDWPFTDE
ncbi:MAG: M28 family peptidase [Ignavibacteria bacterium]|nr:M28 family peptidase [Ignavibacteria bacterium]